MKVEMNTSPFSYRWSPLCLECFVWLLDSFSSTSTVKKASLQSTGFTTFDKGHWCSFCSFSIISFLLSPDSLHWCLFYDPFGLDFFLTFFSAIFLHLCQGQFIFKMLQKKVYILNFVPYCPSGIAVCTFTEYDWTLAQEEIQCVIICRLLEQFTRLVRLLNLWMI